MAGWKTVKLVINNYGFYKLRSANGVIDDLERRAEAIQTVANHEGTAPLMGDDQYVMGSQQGEMRPSGRWRTSVAATSWKARYDNAKFNTLLNALDIGRL